LSKECKKNSKKCKNECAKRSSIGGQALIEGIMMRGPQVTAMAVRDPDGEMVLEKWENSSSSVPKFLKLPIIRGVYGFISSMKLGYKCLMRSAEISGLEELEEEMKREKEEKKAKKKAKKSGTVEETTENPHEEIPQEASESADNPISEDSAAEETVTEEPIAEASETENKAEPEKKDEAKKSKNKEKEGSALTNSIMIIAVVLAVILSVGLFVFLPVQIYKWISPALPYSITGNYFLNSLVKSCFEGVLKIALLVGYMFAVSFMKDIKRTFMYHGAEHKTIFCYEHGKELTVENVRGERREHPRCGTSFLILMLLVGIFISLFIDPLFLLISGDPLIFESGLYIVLRTVVKILLIPLIMGIGYELIKFAGRHDNIVTKIISAPGMWLQHLTVKEPTDDMIECAIAAFVEVIPENEKKEMASANEASVDETVENETNE